jgi:hypothetical protein
MVQKGGFMEALEPTHDRRSFLGKLGKTLGVGLGLSLATSESALGRSGSCETQCHPVAGSCETACCTGNPPCPTNLFHCITACGYDYYQCMARSCGASFCLDGC